MVGHAHGGDDAVQWKDQIQHDDLANGRGKADLHSFGAEQIVIGIRVNAVMDFLGGFPDKEQAARDQDKVAPWKTMAKGVEYRRGQLHNHKDQAEQDQAQAKGKTNADKACFWPFCFGQFIGDDGDEDQIVYPQNHFHGD